MKVFLITIILLILYTTSYAFDFSVNVYNANNFNEYNKVIINNSPINVLVYTNTLSNLTNRHKIDLVSLDYFHPWIFIGNNSSVDSYIFNNVFQLQTVYSQYTCVNNVPQIEIGDKINDYINPYISIEDLNSELNIPSGYKINKPAIGIVIPISTKNISFLTTYEYQSISGSNRNINSYSYGNSLKFTYKRISIITSFEYDKNFIYSSNNPLVTSVGQNEFGKLIYKTIQLRYRISRQFAISGGLLKSNLMTNNIRFINLDYTNDKLNIGLQTDLTTNDNSFYVVYTANF